MDGKEVLLNILHEMKDNLRVLFNWGPVKPGDQLIRARFDKWSRACHAAPVHEAANNDDDAARVVCRFAEIAGEHLLNGQNVDDCRTELTRIQKELVSTEARLFHLRMSQKQLEDQRQQEIRSRMDVISDLKSRLQSTAKRTACSIRLAKACSELARKEWENEIKKPIEERKFHFDTLGSRLQTLIRENATVEAQLTKCREENEAEVVQVTIEMEDEIKKRQELLEQLKKEVAEECVHLQKLEESLSVITVDYDVIMDRRRKEAEDELRRRLEERARERAAIKIQQWFRFYLFRTMKARKRRKKAKRKISREVKREQSVVSANAQESKKETEQNIQEELDDTPTHVTVLVSRKSDNNKSTDPDHVEHDDSGKSKKKSNKKGAARSVNKKESKNKEQEVNKTRPAAAANLADSNNVSRASQTDNRVPKTKQSYR